MSEIAGFYRDSLKQWFQLLGWMNLPEWMNLMMVAGRIGSISKDDVVFP